MIFRASEVRCWRMEEWPAEDRQAWTVGCNPGDPFDDEPHYGATLRLDSRQKAAKGYGRWLSFLASHSWLNDAEPPQGRVTKARLRIYFQELKSVGNADHTIVGRFDELARALRIMVPGWNSSWIRKPYVATLHSVLRPGRRTLFVPDVEELLDWGYHLMEHSDEAATEISRLCAFRDGLLIAILASCGRRLRSMSLLRVGKEVVCAEGVYRIELQPEQVKTNRRDSFALQPELNPYIDRYLGEIRPKLLMGAQHDAFWISARCGAWTSKAIQGQVLACSRKRFGIAFGPHRFRHAIASSASHLDPANPALAAGVLGISRETVQEAYNRAGQAKAVVAYEALLTSRRKMLTDRR